MSITPWISTVTKVANGTDVSSQVINPILSQHTQREQHLYEKLAAIADKSVLTAFDQPIREGETVVKNNVVYFKRESDLEGLAPAQVNFVVKTTNSSFSAANSAYAFGLVKSVNSAAETADVYLTGLVELDVDIDDPTGGFLQTSEIDVSADWEPGPLFLSRTEAGKVTRNPGGVAIFVGYSLTRRKLLLAPNVSEFSQFFTTYRFNLLDRTAGRPLLTGSTWTVEDSDDSKVGWIGVTDLSLALQALAPTGSKFFYNLPPATEIAEDTGIEDYQQEEQTDLAKSLPPNPPNLSLLIVNGVIQTSRDDDPDQGIYKIDDVGIWWFDDQDGFQPWAYDTPATISVTLNDTTDIFTTSSAHGFEVGDRVQFNHSGGAFPTIFGGGSMTGAPTEYFVVSAPTTTTFQIGTAEGGAAINFTSTGSNLTIAQPYIWKEYKGTEAYRPKAAIQFIRFNPSLKDALVSSLKNYNPASTALRFYRADKSSEASQGDLLARLLLQFSNGTDATSSAKAIKSLAYDETTGLITVTNTPIISKLTQGSGIVLTESSTEPGNYLISSAINNTVGRVSSIEPNGAELRFAGLHSYMSMTNDVSSIIGKVILPAGLPNADMTFVLLLLGLDAVSSTKTVDFEFTYAVSKVGTIVSSLTSIPATVTFNMPNPYVAKTIFKIGNASDAHANPTTLKIPASAFVGGDCVVNFQLTRKTPVSTIYSAAVGIVDMYWKIG